jgi:hypothetical protein
MDAVTELVFTLSYIVRRRYEMNKMWTSHKAVSGLAYAAGILSLVLAFAFSFTGGIASAAPLAADAPGLGAAGSYSALGKAGVTNTGPSVLSGNVGADSSITGFPPGTAGGSFLAPDVNGAEADASTADLALTAQAGSASPAGPDLTGATLVPGVYSVGSALLPGVLTLNGAGVYVFLADALTFSGSVSLTNGAAACNVFWHVTSGAAITGGSFVGTIIAGTSITFGDGASLDGRALALTGNVTLINNSIFGPSCAAAPTEVSPATSVPATSVAGATAVSSTAAPALATPGATAVQSAATLVSGATAVIPVLIPVTGADLTVGRSQVMNVGLGILGLGLVLLGFVLLLKRGK